MRCGVGWRLFYRTIMGCRKRNTTYGQHACHDATHDTHAFYGQLLLSLSIRNNRLMDVLPVAELFEFALYVVLLPHDKFGMDEIA